MVENHEVYDNTLAELDLDEIKSLVIDQIKQPGTTNENYLKVAFLRMDKEEKSEFAREISFILSDIFPIDFDDEIRNDYQTIYNMYRLLVMNLISGLTIYVTNYLDIFTKKKAFMKAYSDIRPTRPGKSIGITRENYIVVTNIQNIIQDICLESVTIEDYLKYIDKASDSTIFEFIKGLFADGLASETGIVKAIYDITKKAGLLDSIITKVLMDYRAKHMKDQIPAFATSEDVEIDIDEDDNGEFPDHYDNDEDDEI